MRKKISGGAASSFTLGIAIAAGMMANSVLAAPSEATESPGFVWKDGAEIYAKVCGYCHESNVGPVIRGRDLPPAYIHSVVRNGNRAMPSFRSSEIDDESLAKLAEYISKK
ncbi:MAG: c-type cytochrome [Nitrosospira sp.]